ncbi:heparinase II/III-family protein [candidate division KSB1 bacterium]|nr:heparinase II/III-family protein [candidate division KSB1 bacterium]
MFENSTPNIILLSILLFAIAVAQAKSGEPGYPEYDKQKSIFFPEHLLRQCRTNVENFQWAADIQKSVVTDAEPWLQFSDDQLWRMMFGNTISRSWMVWSNGYCPACKTSVPMYNWIMDPINHPWKTQCPHCKEFFPKNDFYKFYQSGLDEQYVFDPKRADRSLLYNAEHPDSSDPLHAFGVDDGEGYVADGHRWRFIGAYLIYGQWKKLIVDGIRNLSAAYAVTGEARYAHKAGILLDRVADLYPTFDFAREGIVYERRGDRGYVSTWHDACEETREIALAYDRIFEALKDDAELVSFLSEKAKQFKLNNPRSSFTHIRKNIEDGILREVIQNSHKIETNYPRKEFALVTMKTILGWDHNREEIIALLDSILAVATAVDGMTGEKGIVGYTTIGPRSMGELLGQYSRIDPDFISEIYQRHPRLYQTFRFHIDTWCLHQYYPHEGDGGWFSAIEPTYRGVTFSDNPGIKPSMYTLFGKFYELTRDPAFMQVMFIANGDSVRGLPFDLFAENPSDFQKGVKQVIRQHGRLPKVFSVNKQEWHLAILRSGDGEDARALWLDYDAGGRHSHADGLNFGLFAKGIDMLPDLGYPPVQYGGWESPRAKWYRATASHNTVVVDGKDHADAAGKVTLWADGTFLHAICASAPDLIGGKQFERSLAMIDISEKEFYVLDIFRVVAGKDHARFMHSNLGQIESSGLNLQDGEEFGHATQLRHFREDAFAKPGWYIDWKLDPPNESLPAGTAVHLRYTDLTANARAITCEAWISTHGFNFSDEAWIPCIITRRQAEKDIPLQSTFVGVIEPYTAEASITKLNRLPLVEQDQQLLPESHVALELDFQNGMSDLIIALDTENLQESSIRPENALIMQKDRGVELIGEMCLIRQDNKCRIRKIAICHGSYLKAGEVSLRLKKRIDFMEFELDGKKISLLSGDPAEIETIRVNGKNVWIR